MGRVARPSGSDSGRAVQRTKNIGKQRTKRRKRKDLEELHRNILAAKRSLRTRAPQKKKRKAALGRVLRNFADKRQENEDANHGLAGRNGKKRKSKTICNRLLPEPVLGIYQNGAKGQEVHRATANPGIDKINAARLQGDVLTLLNGDESNRKSSWNRDVEPAEKAKGSKAFHSDESDYASSTGARETRTDSPVLGETKRVHVQRINEEKRMNFNGDYALATAGAENEQNHFPQREDKCKRRLFEPNNNDVKSGSNSLGKSGNQLNFMMDEIRFSPPRAIDGEVSPSPVYCFQKNQPVEMTQIETKKKLTSIEEATNDANFWDWSPSIYYERLCAMICADNFENNRGEPPRGPDPLFNIRRSLRELYSNTGRYWYSSRKTVIVKGKKCRQETPPKVSNPNTTDTEMDRESSNSDGTKVGSWRPRHLGRIFYQKNSRVLSDTTEATVASKNHEKESHLTGEKPAVAGTTAQNHLCEETTDSVEKTIHSVSLFLEKLRENNPLNAKGNIFQEELAAARLSGQKEHLSDYPMDVSSRDLTFDMNLRNVVRRNTKHVPTILRRSNSRYGLADRLDEKHGQPWLSNNWPENRPKRATRTLPAFPRFSPPKSDGTDDDPPTPSIVAKEKILRSKFHLTRSKYRCDARSSVSSESLRKRDQYIAKEREISTDDVFINAPGTDDREWQTSDFLFRNQEHAGDPTFERRENSRESGRVNFDKKKYSRDIKESSIPTFDRGFPEDLSKHRQPPSSRHDNPRYGSTSSISTFEFARPDLPKNLDTRDRQIFPHEMANSRGTRSRVSRISNTGASATQCVNEIQFLSEERVERTSMCRKSENQTKNESFKALSSCDAGSLCVVRSPSETAERARQSCRGVATLRQRFRRPVMLFRPIQETRRQHEILDSHYPLPVNGEANTVNDAVRNMRVLTFDENSKNQSCSQRQAHHAPETYQPRCHQQQSLSQPHCHRQLYDNWHSQEIDPRPAKYLAFDETDCRVPRRVPIYVKTDPSEIANTRTAPHVNREVEPSKLLNACGRLEDTETMCLRCRDIGNPRVQQRQHAARVQCCGHEQGLRQVEEQPHRRASQVTLVLPCPAPLCQQASTGLPATNDPTLGPSSIKGNIPRVVYSMTTCETLAPAETTYQLEPPLYVQSRYDNARHPKRVELPDGRLGILVSENCSIDNPERLNTSRGSTLSFERIDTGTSNDTYYTRPSLVNEKIYY